jgi:cation diffusion facilitator family transporter
LARSVLEYAAARCALPMNDAHTTFAGPDQTLSSERPAATGAQQEMRTRNARTRRSIIVGLGANVAIAMAKAVGAAMTGSSALFAEAVHSLADSGNGALLLWGRREARSPPTADHPFGHGRATYFWSFIVALLMFSAGGIASIYQGIHKLQAGTDVESPWLAIGILLFALVAEGTAQVVTVRSINRRRGKLTLWQWLRETRHSELIVVFAEDAAALIGIAIALAAVAATLVTDDEVYDAAGSIAIGILLVVVAAALAIEIKSLLIGESAPPTVRKAIVEFLEARDAVVRVTHLISSQHGEQLMLGIKAEMDERLSASDLIATINQCETELRAAFPQVEWIFFEPVASGEATRSTSTR